MSDEAYHRLGDAVWTRFRALGLPEAATQTVVFFRHPSREWADPERADLGRLLAEATDWALARPLGDPDAQALEAYAAPALEVVRARNAPQPARRALVLAALDSLSSEEIARLTGSTSSAVHHAVQDFKADEESGTEGVHTTTLALHAFALEALDPLKAGQVQDHLAICPECFARFERWTLERDAFEVLPAPPPPPRPSRLIPVVLFMGLGCLVCTGAGIGVAVVQMSQQAEEASTWHGEPPTLQLLIGDDPITGAVPIGAPVTVRFDPKHAGHYGLARQNGEALEVLILDATLADGWTEAPVQLLVTTAPEQSVRVVTADRPLNEQDLRAPSEDLGVTETFLEVLP